VASHIVGREMRRMIDEPAARNEIHEALKPLFDALTVTTNPIPIKTALRTLGHEVGGFRLPMVDASSDEEAEIRAALERQGLLSRV
jgi:4-hydroxy-tetrahydrodipicolinate synthase